MITVTGRQQKENERSVSNKYIKIGYSDDLSLNFFM
jgi:hypothetical protein